MLFLLERSACGWKTVRVVDTRIYTIGTGIRKSCFAASGVRTTVNAALVEKEQTAVRL